MSTTHSVFSFFQIDGKEISLDAKCFQYEDSSQSSFEARVLHVTLLA